MKNFSLTIIIRPMTFKVSDTVVYKTLPHSVQEDMIIQVNQVQKYLPSGKVAILNIAVL